MILGCVDHPLRLILLVGVRWCEMELAVCVNNKLFEGFGGFIVEAIQHAAVVPALGW